MAVHDVDKKNLGRTQPIPNTNDGVMNRMAHNTLSTTYKTESSENLQRITFKNNILLFYDSDNKISSCYGYIPSLSDIPVFIIAKDGSDVFEDIVQLTPPEV